MGRAACDESDAAVCVYPLPGVGVVTSHRIALRRDMPFSERGSAGLCIATLSADSLALCPVARPRGGLGGVAVFGQDRSERSYPLRAGSSQDAVSMTLLPSWLGRLEGPRRVAARGLVDGVGETCPDEVAGVLDRTMRSVTPLFGGRLADGRDVLGRVSRAVDLVLSWHMERERAEEEAGTLVQARLVRAAKRLVARRLDGDLTLDALARELLTSRSRLCAAFRAETGENLGAYVTRVRMERACQLLSAPTASVAEVARAVGYRRTSSFIVAFERAFGSSPGSWRRNPADGAPGV